MCNRINNIIVFFAVLFFSSVCEGQNKQIHVPIYQNSDTCLWFKWAQLDVSRAGLPNLTTSKDSLHFRFLTETQAIDIWTADFITFNGTIANFTTAYNSNKKSTSIKDGRFYSNVENIDTATCRKIYNIFTSLSIFNIPTDDNIPGWSSGEDGTTFLIETSTPQEYSFKTYWTPSVFKDSLIEAATIDTLAKQLQEVLRLEESFGAFISQLPIGCYHYVSYVIICREKEKKWKRRKN